MHGQQNINIFKYIGLLTSMNKEDNFGLCAV